MISSSISSRARSVTRVLPRGVSNGVRLAAVPQQRSLSMASTAIIQFATRLVPSSNLSLGEHVHKRFKSDKADPTAFWTAPKVDYKQVKRMSRQPSPDVFLVDVREPDEVAQGSIPSSVSIPLSSFEKSMNMPAIDFKSHHGFEKPMPEQEVVVYCRSGKRSATAADEFQKLGYKNVKNYSGSWLDWVEQEQKVQKKNNWDDDD